MQCHSRKGFPWHLVCAGLAVIVLALAMTYGRGGARSWTYALLILCPIIHIGIMIAGAKWISSRSADKSHDQTPANG